MGMPSKIVITAIGSLGDLHPYLAIALELRARGHDVAFATCECYRTKIESTGLSFRRLRPDCQWLSDSQAMRRYSDLRLGLIRLWREWQAPRLRESYDDTLAAIEGADVLLTQTLWLAGRLAAEKTGIPWISTVHMPMFFFSAYDLPVLPLSPTLFRRLRFLGPTFWEPLLTLSKRRTRFLAKPWYALRRELDLPATDDNPLGGSHSPRLVLALFSRLLAEKQPDWPPQTVVTGFPFYDRHGMAELPGELTRFLDDGPPPIVFTLGTAVSADAGQFFDQSATAVRSLGRRAVLILNDRRNRPTVLPHDVIAVDYAPFSQLFPRAAAVVHHGGVGTTGLAMRSGCPTLVMPCAWDQPDNAARAARLGIARVISRRRYRADRVAAELRQLLDNPGYSRRASQLAEQMRREDGAKAACDALEGSGIQ